MAGRHDNAFFGILSKPGIWIQKLTTKEPEEEMIQVAILSVESVIYGKDYVKAVNDAQGIGKTMEKSTHQDVKDADIEGIVLGDDLESEEDEITSDDASGEEWEQYADEDLTEEEEA